MTSVAEALSRTAQVLLLLVGGMYFVYGREVFFPFVALALSPLLTQRFPKTPQAFGEAGGLALGHLGLLGVEYLGKPEALLGGGVDGIMNLTEVGLILVSAPLLVVRGMRGVAGLFLAFQIFALLPMLPLSLLHFGTPDGWIYLTHTIIRLGLCVLLVQGWRTPRV